MTWLWVLLPSAVFCAPSDKNLGKGLSKAPVGLWSVTVLISSVISSSWQCPASLCAGFQQGGQLP